MRIVLAATTVLATFASLPHIAIGLDISKTSSFQQPESRFEILRGQVDLPSDGYWTVTSVSSPDVKQFYVLPPAKSAVPGEGRRMYAALRKRRITAGRWKVGALHRPSIEFARKNNGIGPSSFEDFAGTPHEYLKDWNTHATWKDVGESSDGKPLTGPFVFMVPKAMFHFTGDDRQRVAADKREVLAVELRPYVDDGKHWVLFTDGSTVRRNIDEQFAAQHGIKIVPVVDESMPAGQPTSFPYVLVAVHETGATQPKTDSFQVTLLNPITGEEESVHWPTTTDKKDPSLVETLKLARATAMAPYLRAGPSPVLRYWSGQSSNNNQRTEGDLSMFSVLGGRAAIEETLQLQNLIAAESDGDQTVPLSSISGITVKAHPYQEMLEEKSGGQLQLANTVPPDRFFVYVAQPKAILPMLEKGGGFVSSIGASLTGNRLHYNLVEEYLDRMAINRAWIEATIRTGLVKEFVATTPDLFFIDGTDVTVTARLADTKLLRPILQMAGIKGLQSNSILEITARDGRKAYWSLQGDLLSISTSRSELQEVVNLIEQSGEGSLGKSDEFRYMLSQVPLDSSTRCFAYFSDPFVRRLVGPQTKLAQLRRMKARQSMEFVTAKLMLARADGIQDIKTISDLERLGYLPTAFPSKTLLIDESRQVQSSVYGSLTRMATLASVPLKNVTKKEAKAYQRYRENYSRYWRQFFDPIAMRLNDTDDGGLELTTFILPLIDSSIYNQLRDVMRVAEDGGQFPIPLIAPEPILTFSANLAETAWHNVADGMANFFQQYSGANPALLDDLGPSAHIAIFDADPVISLGSGDVLGAFGSNALRSRGSTMLMLPVALSVVTRPCTILVETRNPGRTAQLLRQAAQGHRGSDQNPRWFQSSFYQVADRDKWVWTSELEGIVKLRFGVEVTDGYLVIRNIPWSTDDRVTGKAPAPLLSANLSAHPAACRKQLPGLFAAAADQQRKSVMSGLGRLYPFMLAGARDVSSAADEHEALFGFRPIIEANDAWQWDSFEISSSQFGTPRKQQQPGFDPNLPFGLLQDLESLQLSMQFEDAGLRSKIRWKLREKE